MDRRRYPFFRAMLAALVVTVFASAPAPAAEEKPAASAETQAEQKPNNLLTMIQDSGWNGLVFMSVLGLFSMATVAIILERFVRLSRNRVIPPDFVRELHDLVQRGPEDPRPFRDLCERFPSPTADILKAGLTRAGRPVPEVEKGMEDALAREVISLRSGVKPLTVAANVAPLIGLLGTVIGIIMAFHNASQQGLGNKSEVMAEGISLALLATAGGLAIAIPGLLFAALFNNRIDRLVREADDYLVEVIPCLARMTPPKVERPAARERAVPVEAAPS